MIFFKSFVRCLCKPPESMKGDYRYVERKYLNISILCQTVLSFAPAIISIFIDINYNPKRAIFLIPFYVTFILFMYLRRYQLLTVTMMITTIFVKVHYCMSVDRGIVLFTPFFFLIFSTTFIPSKKFLVFGYILIFGISYFIIENRLINFLQTAPREEIVTVFQKSFTTMLQIFSISFCHCMIGRLLQEKVHGKLLALKSTVAAQNQELQKVNQDLVKALESRESFILSFSHETRNPLNGIIGNLHLLSETDLSSAKAKHFLQKANICSKILNNILLTILDSRRTGQSAIDINLKLQTVDMSAFISDTWTLCREIVKSKDVTAILNISPHFPRWLVFDPERITQVVMNLVNNAMKFTQKGYIKVSFDWKPLSDENYSNTKNTVFFTSCKVRLDKEFNEGNALYPPDWFHEASSDEKGSLLISVEDTGCSISEINQKIIFDKFSQVTENLNLRSLGLGLGLWISKAIVSLHEGEILVKSKEGVGTCFTATISTTSKPLDQDKQASPLLFLRDRCVHKKPTLKGLIVEDFPINQNINSEMLKKYGFTDIEIAANGQEGLNIFKNRGPHYFDLITMDLEMPVMKGKEAITLMRKWEAENSLTPTEIIVISGNAIEKEVNECLDVKGNIRADAFLAKPCSYKMLAEALRKLGIGTQEHQQVNGKNLFSLSSQGIPPTKKTKILFADDDFFNLDILTAYAQKLNLEYLAARDGEEAYHIFENNCDTIDIVFLDFNMPLMNGPEVCDKIRKKMTAIDKKCRIYLLSGVNPLEKEIGVKFDGIIPKPLIYEKFEEIILKK